MKNENNLQSNSTKPQFGSSLTGQENNYNIVSHQLSLSSFIMNHHPYDDEIIRTIPLYDNIKK